MGGGARYAVGAERGARTTRLLVHTSIYPARGSWTGVEVCDLRMVPPTTDYYFLGPATTDYYFSGAPGLMASLCHITYRSHPPTPHLPKLSQIEQK